MSIVFLRPKPWQAFFDDVFPGVPYVGHWLLNFCVDVAASTTLVWHCLAQPNSNSLRRAYVAKLATTLFRYPWQLLLTLGSLLLNAISSLINNVCLCSQERTLTPEELSYLKPIFGNSVDYRKIRLQFGGVKEMLRISPQAVGNDIFIRSFWGVRTVFPDGSLSGAGRRLLAHEVAHVWQFQHTGAGYIGDSLITQTLDSIGRKLNIRLSDGYDLHTAIKNKRTVDQCNVEQQAVMAELIGLALCENEQNELTLDSFNRVSGYNLSEEEFACATHARLWFESFQFDCAAVSK